MPTLTAHARRDRRVTDAVWTQRGLSVQRARGAQPLASRDRRCRYGQRSRGLSNSTVTVPSGCGVTCDGAMVTVVVLLAQRGATYGDEALGMAARRALGSLRA
jgi:hypothetical protein